jgi:hypothetical protein
LVIIWCLPMVRAFGSLALGCRSGKALHVKVEDGGALQARCLREIADHILKISNRGT